MTSPPKHVDVAPLSAEIIIELPPRATTPPHTPPHTPPPPRPKQPRFSLWALMVFITGCCVLMGGLAALRFPIWGVLVGFAAIPLFCLAFIGFIELFTNRKDIGRWE